MTEDRQQRTEDRSSSGLIEEAIRFYIERVKRELRDRKDLQIINMSAEKLKEEAEEVLSCSHYN